MSPLTQEMKAKAEVYYGDKVCKEKFCVLLSEKGFPEGLLTIDDIEECGFVKEIGFVWLKLKKKKEYRFDNILVCYDTEVTAYVEPNKIRNLTGVKAKDFWLWFTLHEIFVIKNHKEQEDEDDEVEEDGDEVITFKSVVGLSVSFPLSSFKPGKEIDAAKKNEE